MKELSVRLSLGVAGAVLAALAYGPSPVHAELRMSAQALATVQATLDRCVEIDAGRREDYLKHAGVMFAGMPAQELSEVRGSDAYKDAYRATSEALKEGAPDEVLSACRAFVEGRD